MPTRNVNLTDHFDAFIESGIDAGRYSNASEVVREGLRLLEQRDREDRAKIEWLRGTVRESIASIERGEGMPLDSPEEIDRYIDGIGAEVIAEERNPVPRV
jgi:antitoxin ParD1/3/4